MERLAADIDGRMLAEAGGPAETGGLVAEAGGSAFRRAGGRELAEAAGVAEAGLVAVAEVVTEVTKEASMVAALVSTNSPADAPLRRHYEA